MSWLRIEGRMPSHPKVAPLSDAAFRLHVTAMAWCVEHTTDGHVPMRVPSTLPSVARKKKLENAIQELQNARLWLLADGGWFIKDFLVYNPSSESIAEEKSKRSAAAAAAARARWDAERMRAASESHSGSHAQRMHASMRAGCPDTETHTDSEKYISSTASQDLTGSRRPNPPRPAADDSEMGDSPGGQPESESASEGQPEALAGLSQAGVSVHALRYQAAYERGIATVTGRPFAMPPAQRADLHQAILAHARSESTGKALRGEVLLEFITLAAEDFARFVLEEAKRKPEAIDWYSGLGPKGFLRFLNREALAAEARRVG